MSDQPTAATVVTGRRRQNELLRAWSGWTLTSLLIDPAAVAWARESGWAGTNHHDRESGLRIVGSPGDPIEALAVDQGRAGTQQTMPMAAEAAPGARPARDAAAGTEADHANRPQPRGGSWAVEPGRPVVPGWRRGAMISSKPVRVVSLAIVSVVVLAEVGGIVGGIGVAGGPFDGRRGTAGADAGERTPVVVESVLDGDTVEVTTRGGTTVRVRFLGISAPEMPHPREPGECYGYLPAPQGPPADRHGGRAGERLEPGRCRHLWPMAALRRD